MVVSPAPIALEELVIDQPMLVALATRTPEPIGTADILQSSLTLLLDSVKPLKLSQKAAFLELDDHARHSRTGMSLLVQGPGSPCAAQAG